MKPEPGEEALVRATYPEVLTGADRAFLLCLRAWWPDGSLRPTVEEGEAALRADLAGKVWPRLEPSWSRRLSEAWGLASTQDRCADPEVARERLRRMHCATARVDFTRVHSSWWARALQDESPAIRRLVAASAPPSVRMRVSDALFLDKNDLAACHPVNAEVRDWVLALWTERLVGDEPERPDDPPAIIVLTRLSARAGYRLCRCAGVAKLALAGQEPVWKSLRPLKRARWAWLCERLRAAAQEAQDQARRDVGSSASAKVPSRQIEAWLGAQALARLLADCEPFRLRWALQHWPYTIAKLVRTLMPPSSKRSARLAQAEALILKNAWDRLNLEGRLTLEWPGPQWGE